MAKKKKHIPPKAWKKGQSGNPSGRPKDDPALKRAKELNQIQFEKIMNKYLHLTPVQVERRLKDKSKPMIELLLGNIIHQAYAEGDVKRAEWIMGRMIGKPAERLEINARRKSQNLSVSVEVNQGQLGQTDGNISPHQAMAELEAMQQKLDVMRDTVDALPATIDAEVVP